MDDDDDSHWVRQLLMAIGGVLAVALVIAGVVSAFALGAAKVSGIDDPSATTTTRATLVLPSPTPSASVAPAPGSSSVSPAPSRTSAPAKKSPVTLTASPLAVGPNERINLTGDYPRGGDGAQLQVQRFDGEWTDFPVTATVAGGRFSTYIQSSKTGKARFRVIDHAAGHASNEVRVTIG